MKKVVSLITLLAVVISLFAAIPVFADEPSTGTFVDAAGNADALTWAYDATSKTLTISVTARKNGTNSEAAAAMPSYKSNSDLPYAAYKSSTEKVVFENGITDTGDYSFYQWKGIKSIKWPESGLTRVGNFTFGDCSGLAETELNLPKGVTTIGSNAFAYCRFSVINLPESLTTIGDKAFIMLEVDKLVIPKNVTSVAQGLAYHIRWREGISNSRAIVFEGGRIKELTLGYNQWFDSTVSVFSEARNKDVKITEIYLPEKVFIAEQVQEVSDLFGNMNKLYDVEYGTDTANLKIFVAEQSTYDKLNNLKYTAEMPKPTIIKAQLDETETCKVGSMNVSTIPSGGFWAYNSANGTLNIYGDGKYSDDWSNTANNPVAKWSGFTQDMANGVKTLKMNGLMSHPTNIFSAFPNVEKIELSDLTLSLGNLGISGSKVKEIVLPSNMTSCVEKAFSGAKNLEKITVKDAETGEIISKEGEVTLPRGITVWPKEVFSGCDALSGTAVIPNTVTEVCANAMYTTNISSVVFESGNENEVVLGDSFIGTSWEPKWALSGLKNFKGIVMPEKIKSMGKNVLCNSLAENTNGAKIIFPGDAPTTWDKNTAFANVGSYTSKSKAIEILYRDNKSGWDSIGAEAFGTADKITLTKLYSTEGSAGCALERNEEKASLTYYCGSDYVANEKYLLIMAAYKDSQLVGIKYTDGTFLKDTNSITSPISIAIDKGDGVTYRAFLLDEFSKLTPLYEAK